VIEARAKIDEDNHIVLGVLMQRLRIAVAFVVAVYATTGSSSTNGLRNVFLNGIDISSAKSQDLKHVDVRISETGDIFLVAPHYQVNEEDSFVPLSRYVQGLNQPVHQPAQMMSGTVPAKSGPAMPPSVPMGEAVASGASPVDLPGASAKSQLATPGAFGADGAANDGNLGSAGTDGLEPKAGQPAPKAASDSSVPPLPTTPETSSAAVDKAATAQPPGSTK